MEIRTDPVIWFLRIWQSFLWGFIMWNKYPSGLEILFKNTFPFYTVELAPYPLSSIQENGIWDRFRCLVRQTWDILRNRILQTLLTTSPGVSKFLFRILKTHNLDKNYNVLRIYAKCLHLSCVRALSTLSQ